jgi:hypothetical protein
MTHLVPQLIEFNAKERYWLLRNSGAEFALSDVFRDKLQRRFPGLPSNLESFVAMDYHLDWLHASVLLSCGTVTKDSAIRRAEHPIRATQEDIDLLVVFTAGERHHVVMLEAKGVTGWSNTQLQSKAQRLRAIFDVSDSAMITPYFGVISPAPPEKVRVTDWPSWMRAGDSVPWIQLELGNGFSRVVRCDKDAAENSDGEFWKIVSR